MKICVYGAASSLIDNHYIEAGIELGKELADKIYGELNSLTIPKPNHDSSTNQLIKKYWQKKYNK